MASVTITVAGVDRTEFLCQPPSGGQALEFSEALRERPTLAFSLIRRTGTWKPQRGQHVTMTHSVAGALFGGYITDVSRRKEGGSNAGGVFFDCTCVAYEQILDRRRSWAHTYLDETPGAIFESVMDNSLDGEGFTVSIDDDGPAIPKFEIQSPRPSVREVADAICEQASNGDDVFYWSIDTDKVIHFFKQDTTAAPISITDANPYVLGGDGEYANVNESNAGKANRVFVYMGQYLRPAATESFVGDGATRSFELAYPCGAKPSIKVNSVEIGDFIGVEGQSGYQWYWQLNSKTIRQDESGTLLTGGDTLDVTYQGLDRLETAPIEDAADASAEGVLQGDGTGIYEAMLTIDTPQTLGDAETFAAAYLAKYTRATVTFRGATYTAGLRSGQELTVNLTDLDINLSMLIQSVSMADHGAGNFLWSFTAIYGAARDDWKRALLGKDPSTGISGGSGASGAGSGSGGAGSTPLAPDVTASLTSVTSTLWANVAVALFTGTITLPTTNPNYADHFIWVAVDVITPSGVVLRLAEFLKPAVATTIALSAYHKEIRLTSSSVGGYTLRFTAFNEENTPSATPYEITGVTVPAVTVTALTATDATGSRWQGADGSVHAVLDVAIQCSAYPQVVTIWTSSPQYGRIMHGWFTITGSMTVSIGAQHTGSSIFPPTSATSETETVYAAIGTYDDKIDPTTITGVVSDTESVAGPPAPGATEATEWYITSATPVYDGGPGGASLFRFRIQGKLPITAADGLNFYAARLLVQTKDSGGSAGGQRPNTMDPDDPKTRVGDYAGPTAFYQAEDHADNVHGDPSTGAIVWDVLGWTVPSDGYPEFHFEIWVSSRRSGGTWTRQNAWSSAAGTATPGTNSSQKLVVDGTKSKVLGPQVSGSVPSADAVPFSGVTGPINVGGGGTAVEIWSVKNAAGTVIAWIGKKTVGGTDYYGIWGANIWIGGTDPTNPKAYIDGSGNLRLLGIIESGSSITVTTADGTVTITPSSGGIEVVNGSDQTKITPTLVSVYDGTNISFLASDEFSVKNGKFHVNSSALLDVYNSISLVGVGVPYLHTSASGSISTDTTVDTNIVHGAGAPAGLYRISVKFVVTNFGSAGFAAANYIASDGGVVGSGTIIPSQIFGAGQPQVASSAQVVYSNGGGIVLRVQTTGMAGGAAFNWYAVVERLT